MRVEYWAVSIHDSTLKSVIRGDEGEGYACAFFFLSEETSFFASIDADLSPVLVG